MPVEFDHDAARPPEPSKPIEPEAFPRAAFRLADLLDELVRQQLISDSTVWEFMYE